MVLVSCEPGAGAGSADGATCATADVDMTRAATAAPLKSIPFMNLSQWIDAPFLERSVYCDSQYVYKIMRHPAELQRFFR
jgi:hypothetical protein